jgi:DNA-binding transcriptional MerR regulator
MSRTRGKACEAREVAVALPDGVRTIAQVAEEFGVTHRTIRFYEDRGLIAPQRRGTQRLFHPRDRVRLDLVLRGKRLGFDLEQIRRIVDMYDQQVGERGQMEYLLAQLAARRADLEQRRHDIDRTLAELDAVERRCRDSEVGRTLSAPTSQEGVDPAVPGD